MRPPAMPTSAKTVGIFSQTRMRPSRMTTSINNGTSHSIWSPPRARSKPLAVSFSPPQLTCTHGRKKQTKTKTAALKVTRLVPFIRSLLVPHPSLLSPYVNPLMKPARLSSSFFSRPLPHDLNRAGRVIHDGLRDASQQPALNPRVAVRADDDQVSRPFLGLIHDHRTWVPPTRTAGWRTP